MMQPTGSVCDADAQPQADSAAPDVATPPARASWLVRLAPCCVLTGVALVIGLWQLGASGPIWPDGPRYANGAAMIHDWLRSGEWLSPYEFAKKNYAQYPAFSIPFHPPVYPGMMGVMFLFTGVSYESARVFVALSAAVMACLVYLMLRYGGLARAPSFMAGLLLLTTPEMARWSRCTMSEVPSTALIIGASLLFLRWVETRRASWCWAAFVTAQLAFLCRVTTSAILPAWFLYLIVTRQTHRLWNRHLIAASCSYLVFSGFYVRLASAFAAHEVNASAQVRRFSLENLFYYTDTLPPMLTWGSTYIAVLALAAYFLNSRLRRPIVTFWLCWFVAVAIFKLVVPTTSEIRHFFGSMPALAGVAVCLLASDGLSVRSRRIAMGLMVLAIGLNVAHVTRISHGTVGHEAIARSISQLPQSGNVLLCCWEDQDLIFRYRGHDPDSRRVMLRGDRTLAIRTNWYSPVESRILAWSEDDVINIIEQGRTRYLITCDRAPEMRVDDRPHEMVLAHQIARSKPDAFRQLEQHPLTVHYRGKERRYTCYVWEYLGELPPGPSEAPVLIPTANMEL